MSEAKVMQSETRLFRTTNFHLASGTVLPELQLAYATYGRLAADGRNAVLATHGFTSDHHAAGVRPDGTPGWWSALIGAGKAIDTDRLFVVASNMLGSSYGSTAPRSINPATGRAWGPDFPAITLSDIVGAQKALLDHLGVRHLVAVAGPSYGGFQGFQWAVSYPDFMDGIIAAVTAPRGPGSDEATQRLVARLAADANWNGGHYYDKGGIRPTMTAIRAETLKLYGVEADLAKSIPDAAKREQAIQRLAAAWADEFDGNSMVALRRAMSHFDVTPDLGRIKAKLLYVLSRTDKLFPPTLAPEVMGMLKAAGVDATYFELDSELGHMATHRDAAKWAPTLSAFMASLLDRPDRAA
jgi:homoserine O-acetyltransferase